MVDISAGTISLYTVEDRNGNEAGYGYYEDSDKAEDEAAAIKGTVIENFFKWEDSNLLADRRERCEKCDDAITDENEISFNNNRLLAYSDLDYALLCDPCAEAVLMVHGEDAL